MRENRGIQQFKPFSRLHLVPNLEQFRQINPRILVLDLLRSLAQCDSAAPNELIRGYTLA